MPANVLREPLYLPDFRRREACVSAPYRFPGRACPHRTAKIFQPASPRASMWRSECCRCGAAGEGSGEVVALATQSCTSPTREATKFSFTVHSSLLRKNRTVDMPLCYPKRICRYAIAIV